MAPPSSVTYTTTERILVPSYQDAGRIDLLEADGLHRVHQLLVQKLKDTIRAKTRRTDGRSLPVTPADVNRTLRGWFEYYKHSYKTTFPEMDSWVRMCLRWILRASGRSARAAAEAEIISVGRTPSLRALGCLT